MTMSADLKTRLARLQGSQRPPARDPGLAELLARIERLRGRTRSRSGQASTEDLAEQLGGECLDAGVIRIERRIPLWHRLGRGSLAAALHAQVPELPADPARWLFLDTETTGLAGGTGTLVFLVGLGRLQGDAFVLTQFLCSSYGAERPMLEALAQDIKAGDHLVSFNGKSYDLPLLAARCRLNRVAPPLAALPHLDLLHPLRKAHRKSLPDCKLKTLEEKLLGHRRGDDLPGSEAPRAWQKWLHERDGALLAQVAKHNRQDILAMGALLALLSPQASLTPALLA
ncbi:MAG: ribonuclease H-like domain-containing protein [Pseudomonadota bacterium]